VKRTATATVKLVPLAQLKAHPRNPRRHDRGEIDALKASIIEYGFTEPLIRQASSGHVVAGAGRLQAATELAEEGKLDAVEFTPGVKLNGCLPVVDKRLTDRQALAYCIADNRITERGTMTKDKMSILDAADELCAAMKDKAVLRQDRHGLECDVTAASADWYWMRLIEEVGELAATLRQPKIDLVNATSECADIGNFAACLRAVLMRSTRTDGPKAGMP